MKESATCSRARKFLAVWFMLLRAWNELYNKTTPNSHLLQMRALKYYQQTGIGWKLGRIPEALSEPLNRNKEWCTHGFCSYEFGFDIQLYFGLFCWDFYKLIQDDDNRRPIEKTGVVLFNDDLFYELNASDTFAVLSFDYLRIDSWPEKIYKTMKSYISNRVNDDLQ